MLIVAPEGGKRGKGDRHGAKVGRLKMKFKVTGACPLFSRDGVFFG
jgi:hypothetical protein